jgi:SAM-dependent methyltransferase
MSDRIRVPSIESPLGKQRDFMPGALQPEQIALSEHRDYYSTGGYDDDRLRWTVREFLPECQGRRILEIGCGDGKLLSLLDQKNEVHGIDASESGIGAARARGLAAGVLDVSSNSLPFDDDYFDVVIVLETIEHMMNPYYALQQVRRVLQPKGRLICSVPNPLIGHPFLYPGLFQYENFRDFLEQSGFQIFRVEGWQWAPRETILPRALRSNRLLGSRYVAGTLRRVIERTWRLFGRFPAFCYWLWTFECGQKDKSAPTPLTLQAEWTRPKGRGLVTGDGHATPVPQVNRERDPSGF